MCYQEKRKTLCFLFNTISLFGSHFPDQNQKVKYKLQKKKDGIIIFPKEDICLSFTSGYSLNQLLVYFYDIFLDNSNSIYLSFIRGYNTPQWNVSMTLEMFLGFYCFRSIRCRASISFYCFHSVTAIFCFQQVAAY